MDTLYLLCLKEYKEGGGGSAVIDSLTATENGTYTPPSGVDGYNPVTVDVPPTVPVINPLSVTQNGTYIAPTGVDGYSPITVNVGGASNIVTGKFTGTITGEAMDITLDYSGSGYPIACMVYPSGGPYASGTPFYGLLQNKAICEFFIIKGNPNTPPTYNGDVAAYACVYKNSDTQSNAFNRSTGQDSVIIIKDTDATASLSAAVHIRSKNKMSVFIASTSYGFAANIEYTYHVIYSS